MWPIQSFLVQELLTKCSLKNMIKPQCIDCKNREYKGASYSVDGGYVCGKCWEKRLKEIKLEENAKNRTQIL